MNRADAIRKALNLWGEFGTVVEDATAPTPEDKVTLRILLVKRRDCPESVDRKDAEEAISQLIRFRYRVGILIRNIFVGRGEGDSWEEAFTVAEMREARYNRNVHQRQTQSNQTPPLPKNR